MLERYRKVLWIWKGGIEKSVRLTDEFWTRVGKQWCLNWNFNSLLSVEPRDFSNLVEKLRVLRFTLTSPRFLSLYTSIVPQIQFFVCLQGPRFEGSTSSRVGLMRFNTFYEVIGNHVLHGGGSFRHVPINSLKQRFGISKPIVGYELNIFPSR